MPIDWPQFVDIVNSHQRFLLSCHIRPDCDSLGSELGMMMILEALGKEVAIVNGHATPPNLAFIDPDNRIQVLSDAPEVMAALDSAEVMMVLDTSSWAQLGPMSDVLRNTKAKKVVLDHHAIGDDLGAIEFKNSKAESTGGLVAEAAEALGIALTPESAMPLFAAVSTDTGWFRFPSAKAHTYELAARLIEAGADPPSIFRELYEQDTLGRVKLRGRILERFTAEMDGRLLHTFVRFTDFEETGALPSDTEDAINMGLAVHGSEVATILVELSTGSFKVSFRARGRIDCSQVAASFGGGGHKAAAGATIDGPFEVAQKRVLDAVREAMNDGSD